MENNKLIKTSETIFWIFVTLLMAILIIVKDGNKQGYFWNAVALVLSLLFISTRILKKPIFRVEAGVCFILILNSIISVISAFRFGNAMEIVSTLTVVIYFIISFARITDSFLRSGEK